MNKTTSEIDKSAALALCTKLQVIDLPIFYHVSKKVKGE